MTGSDIDFATRYLRHVLGFLGITDVELIAADRLTQRGEQAIDDAHEQIDVLIESGTALAGAVQA